MLVPMPRRLPGQRGTKTGGASAASLLAGVRPVCHGATWTTRRVLARMTSRWLIPKLKEYKPDIDLFFYIA